MAKEEQDHGAQHDQDAHPPGGVAAAALATAATLAGCGTGTSGHHPAAGSSRQYTYYQSMMGRYSTHR